MLKYTMAHITRRFTPTRKALFILKKYFSIMNTQNPEINEAKKVTSTRNRHGNWKNFKRGIASQTGCDSCVVKTREISKLTPEAITIFERFSFFQKRSAINTASV